MLSDRNGQISLAVPLNTFNCHTGLGIWYFLWCENFNNYTFVSSTEQWFLIRWQTRYYLPQQNRQRCLLARTWPPGGPPPLPAAAPDSPTLPYLSGGEVGKREDHTQEAFPDLARGDLNAAHTLSCISPVTVKEIFQFSIVIRAFVVVSCFWITEPQRYFLLQPVNWGPNYFHDTRWRLLLQSQISNLARITTAVLDPQLVCRQVIYHHDNMSNVQK